MHSREALRLPAKLLRGADACSRYVRLWFNNERSIPTRGAPHPASQTVGHPTQGSEYSLGSTARQTLVAGRRSAIPPLRKPLRPQDARPRRRRGPIAGRFSVQETPTPKTLPVRRTGGRRPGLLTRLLPLRPKLAACVTLFLPLHVLNCQTDVGAAQAECPVALLPSERGHPQFAARESR